jgi:hypothetical protein
MSSRAKKVAHLREHLPYELHMLRHTFLKFTTVHDASDWNAYFVAFAVYARNLHDFLTNDPDSRNFNAKDFVDEFEATKLPKEIRSLMSQSLHLQVFHLGKSRPTDVAEKVDVDRARQLGCWLETNFASFIDGLAPAYRSEWRWDAAGPHKITEDLLHGTRALTTTTLPSAPTATNAPSLARTV